jgi:hypothetical protein
VTVMIATPSANLFSNCNKLFGMKKVNWAKLIGINILLIAIIILPFLPGPPNKLVTVLSALAQSAGFFGLILVPIGLLWGVSDIRNRHNPTPSGRRLHYYLALIATVLATVITALLVWALLATLELFYEGLVGAALTLLLGGLVIKKIVTNNRNQTAATARQLNPVPFYLVTIPLIAFITRVFIMGPLSDYSRGVAMEKGQELIAAIEHYKIKEGQYPKSIRQLQPGYLKNIPDPSVMGISGFRYNKINDHYSLSFSQWLHIGSLEEIVLYDKYIAQKEL